MSLEIAHHAAPPPSWGALAREIGLFYHDPRWIAAVAECYRYPLHCLTASDRGSLVGALALAAVPKPLGRARLVSFPFSYVAGPMARSAAVADALSVAARDLAQARGLARVELKRFAPADAPAPGFVRSDRYRTYVIRPEGGEDAVWKRLHKTSVQQRITKGRKAGVRAIEGESEADWLVLAELQELTARGHGVPAPPRRFFTRYCRGLQREGLADLWIARLPDGRNAAALTIFKGPRQWVYAFGSTDESLVKEYRPIHVILWEAIRRAAWAGVAFDMGRVAPEQAGLAEFKSRWGAEEIALGYDYWPDAGGVHEARRDEGSLAMAAKVWSRLPRRVTRLGSRLYRYLG